MAVKKTTRAKTPARGKKPIGLTSALGPKATTALVICVIAGGIMVGARQQETTRKNAALADTRAEMGPMSAVKPASAPRKAVTVSTASAASPAVATTPAATPAPSETRAARATVVGCLEDDGAAFRLTDTTGADAPKARSWKSGFLKKGIAPVKLVGSSNALNLASHVGRRVSVTGTLANREMQAHALRRVSGSCKAN
jgi:hypothetical protein